VARLFARRAAIAAKDLQWRYEVGRLAHKLRYAASGDFMAKVARALTPNTLRAYARVAEAIASSEFDEHVALRDRFGMPMTWSHLEEIAQVQERTGATEMRGAGHLQEALCAWCRHACAGLHAGRWPNRHCWIRDGLTRALLTE